MTTYAIATLRLPAQLAMEAPVMSCAAIVVMGFVGGWLCDRYTPEQSLLWSRIAVIVVTLPVFELLVRHPTRWLLLCATGVLTGLNALGGAAFLIVAAQFLPATSRASGLGLIYAIGVAAFGGTTQLFVTELLISTGNPTIPAWYAAAASLVSAVAILRLTRRPSIRDAGPRSVSNVQ